MALLDRLNYKHIQKQLSLSPGIEAFPVRNLVSERFGFIDFVRFVSTIGIVWAHIQVFPGNATNYPVVLQNSEYYLGFKQITKFSVINFYLIAGFLLPTVIPSDNRFGYLKRRCRKTIKAYIAALSIFIAGIFISEKGFDLSSFNVTWAVKTVAYLIKYTSFWYLGSYLICLGTLDWIGEIWLGAIGNNCYSNFFHLLYSEI